MLIPLEDNPLETRPKVSEVFPNSQGERLGILEGDFFLDYDGIAFESPPAFIAYRQNNPSNHARTLRVLRGTEILTFEIEPGSIGAQINAAVLPALPEEEAENTP